MSQCKITNVNIVIRPKNQGQDGNVLGFAEVVLENSFVIRNIKILKSNKNGKRFLVFPSQMTRGSKRRYDICYPINQESRKYFEAIIINALDKLLEAQPKGES